MNNQLDLTIDAVKTEENQNISDIFIYSIKVFTNKGKEIANSALDFPIFLDIPCERIVGKDAAIKIQNVASVAKLVFTYGGIVEMNV